MKTLSPVSAALIRALGGLFTPGGSRASLVVLIFHRVLERRDPLLQGEPDAREFAAQLDVIRSVCRVLPLEEAVDRLRSGSLPQRSVSITFDDGYANNRTTAAPLLKERGMPATVFVATGYLNGGRMFNDTVIESVRRAGPELDLRDLGFERFQLADDASRLHAINQILGVLKYRPPAERVARAEAIAEKANARLPNDLMMTDAQVRELASFGVSVGAHTVNHPILNSVDEDAARREIADSRRILQDMTGETVSLFAYPNGRPKTDYGSVHAKMVREAGFKAAVSTAWGGAGPAVDFFQIPRMLPWDTSPVMFAGRLMRTYREPQVDVA
jgi:peptidoglycan/xylan/chitin deacetylase (PgdA/CDA1 family)